jgi:phage major head subunit gpT-like protein
MSVNVQAAINRIFQEFNATMIKAFDSAPVVSPKYAVEVPSSSRSTLHAWLGDQATVREWKGSRKHNSFGTRYWEVVNRSWELSYEFDVNQISDDLSSLVAAAVMRARQNGAKWARHKDLLCAATLEAGFSALCYDGQYYFDTDHPVDVEGITSGTYGNLLTGSPLTHANFYKALKRLHSFKLEDGSPAVPVGTGLKLMYPSALMDAADAILGVKNLTAAASYSLFGTSGATENPLYGKAEPVENAFLTSDTTWYLTAEDDGIMPIMFQRRQAVESNEQGPGSQIYYDQKKVRIGTDARYEASYTLPQLAVASQA